MAILADEKTRILVQGITGREASGFTKDSLEYGAKIVAGVTPGKGGFHVHGVPVYDTVKQALSEHQAEASVISVPPPFVKDAAFEAFSSGIRLLVIVTERVPRKDVVEILCFANDTGARVIGPNSLGLISVGRTKIGMIGGPPADARKAYTPGPVGVLSRSGGMTTEISSLLTQQGIGQSTCVSIGGDPIVGSSFADLVPLCERDPETRAIVLFCEPGGAAEEQLADYVEARRPSLPIVAFVAGRFADEMPGIRFGHAAAIVEGEAGSPRKKIERLRKAGILVADRLSEIVPLVEQSLVDFPPKKP